MGKLKGLPRTALFASAVALGVSTTLFGVTPAHAASVDVDGGSLDWGFKASFRAYVGAGNGNPPIATLDGATRNADGTFDFPATGGTYDASAGTATVSYGGTVVFSYPAHMFEVTLANPTLVVDGDGTGALKADVDLVAYAGTVTQHLEQAEIATLVTTAPAVADGNIAFSGLGATLTEAGASAFAGFYSAGTALDPVDASASSAAVSSESAGTSALALAR